VSVSSRRVRSQPPDCRLFPAPLFFPFGPWGSLPAVNRALEAELLVPVGWRLAGSRASNLRTRSRNASCLPRRQEAPAAANLHHGPPLALLHLGVREGVQAAGVLEGGARGDGGGAVAGEQEEEARDPGAGAAWPTSALDVCALLSR
jgi:hypothetical protein